MVKRLLELFCGTKSVSKVAEKMGYEIVSLDFDPKFDATICEDILEWDYKVYPPDYFDVVWASPDCRTWSFATGGKYRSKADILGKGNIHQEEATTGNKMISRVIEIMKYFTPPTWYIENPRALLQYYPPLIDFIEEMGAFRVRVYYGNYGHGCPKPTHIWTNKPVWEDEPSPNMPEHTYDLKYHKFNKCMKKYYKVFNGFANGEQRSVIPPELIHRLFGLI